MILVLFQFFVWVDKTVCPPVGYKLPLRNTQVTFANTLVRNSSSNGTASFSFSNIGSNPISHGANALKLENEVVSENTNHSSVNEVNNQYHEELLKNQEVENIVEDTSNESETSFSEEAINLSEPQQDNLNDLKEFGVDMDEPDLFSSENKDSSSDDLLGSSDHDDEDDLEIPAFLRRQKN